MGEDDKTQTETLKEIEVYQIEDPPIILHPDDDLQDLKELSDSIKQQGLIQPITLRPKNNHYQLISGHRRVKAAKQFGIPTLTARILNLSDRDALIAAATENIQRLDQDPLQEAHLYHRLITDENEDLPNIARRFGKTPAYITGRLKLLELIPQVQQYVKNKVLTLGAAQALSRIKNPDDQLRVAIELKGAHYNIAHAEAFINSFLYYKETQADLPPDEVIAQSHYNPQMECPICHQTTPLKYIKSLVICQNCNDYITALMYQDLQTKTPTPPQDKKTLTELPKEEGDP